MHEKVDVKYIKHFVIIFLTNSNSFLYQYRSDDFEKDMLENNHLISGIISANTSKDFQVELDKVYDYLKVSKNKKPRNKFELLSPPIKEAVKFVEENYHKNISLELVSQIVHLSSSYLSQLFKKEVGILFTDYVEQIRISAACELLINTDKLIGNVAEEVGFSSQAYFSRQFKKIIGMSPSEFKQANS